jgi:hypothetical protein
MGVLKMFGYEVQMTSMPNPAIREYDFFLGPGDPGSMKGAPPILVHPEAGTLSNRFDSYVMIICLDR